MTPELTDLGQLEISMEYLHSLHGRFPSVGEHSYHGTPKHVDDSVANYYNTIYDTSKYPLNGDCAQCGRPIMDQYFLLANEQIWHVSCLRCALCGCDLQWQTSCFYYKGYLLCRQDYDSSTTCPTCGKRFQEGNLATLQMGDQCFVEAGGRKTVFCLACHQKQNTKEPRRSQYTHIQSVSGSSSLLAPVTVNRKLLVSIPNEAAVNEEKKIQTNNRSTSGTPTVSENPQKRIRTSFKNDQLGVMKAYFEVNQNPASKELRQLSTQTGLSKRVLQVWFQNARANFRKRIPNKEMKTGGGTKSGDKDQSKFVEFGAKE
ncbi:hypothetical protein Aperf_G00000058150 [Anoplocephala perfoliata]